MVTPRVLFLAVVAVTWSLCPAKKNYSPGRTALKLSSYRESIARFTLDLYKKTAQSSDNFAISPLSIHSALSILALGVSSSPARTELLKGLHYKNKVDVNGFKRFYQTLDQNAEVAVKLANAMFTKRGLKVNSHFKNSIGKLFQGEIRPFAPRHPRAHVNRWIGEQTNGKIKDFLSTGSINRDTVLMLANAVYFKGKLPFYERRTSLEPFTDINNKKTNIETMYQSLQFKMIDSRDLSANVLRLPFVGNRISLNIILPYKNQTLSSVESKMSLDTLTKAFSALKKDKKFYRNIFFPKFSLDTETSLQDTLESLGIRRIFGRNSLNLISNDPNLSVSEVKHRSIFCVNEWGPKDIFLNTQFEQYFNFVKVNRPFMFWLRDDENDIDLFVGRYVNPSGDNLSA